MQRILLFTPVIGRAGVAKVFHQHAKDFQAFAYVEEAVFDRAGYASKVYENGVKLNVIDDRIKKLSRLSWLRFFQRLRALKKLVETERFSAVIAHTDGANIMTCLLPDHVKKYLVVHGTSLHKNVSSPTARIREILIKKLYPKANHVICVSDALRLETEELYGIKNCVTIRNYFNERTPDDLEDIIFKRQIFNTISNERFVLVSHGRYSSGKNLGVLLNVVCLLKKDGLKVTLLLVGDGPEYENLAKQADTLGLAVQDLIPPKESRNRIIDPDVVFTGFTNNPIPLLTASHLFVMPSKSEGYPLALCEALLCGIPVLSSDCPTGPREILTRLDSTEGIKCCLLPIPDGSRGAEAWALHIKQIIQDEKLYSNLKVQCEMLGEALKNDREMALIQWQKILDTPSFNETPQDIWRAS